MELQSIDAASTSDAVTFITYVQSLKRQMKQWEKEVRWTEDGRRCSLIRAAGSVGYRWKDKCLLSSNQH